ncbi:MAG: hypothetical protein ACI4GZ_01600 [Ruminococcus sp.]
MKKILAFTMALLMTLSVFGIMGASAVEYSDKFGSSLIKAIENATEDELIPVMMFTKGEPVDHMNLSEYIKYKGFDEETISREEEKDLSKEYNEVYYPEVRRQAGVQYTEIFDEVFGGATPDETSFGIYTPYIGLMTAKDKILLLAGYDMITDIEYVGPDADKTPEEKQFLIDYADSHGLDAQKFCAMNMVTIYGEASGYTLFFISTGAENCLMCEQYIEDVLLIRGFNRGEKNPTGVLTLDKDGNYSTLNKEVEKGTLNIYEAQKVLPFAYLMGDVDFDSVLTVKDATRIQKQIANMEVPVTSYVEEYLKDANRDGEFNIRDTTYLQEKVAGIV